MYSLFLLNYTFGWFQFLRLILLEKRDFIENLLTRYIRFSAGQCFSDSLFLEAAVRLASARRYERKALRKWGTQKGNCRGEYVLSQAYFPPAHSPSRYWTRLVIPQSLCSNQSACWHTVYSLAILLTCTLIRPTDHIASSCTPPPKLFYFCFLRLRVFFRFFLLLYSTNMY